MDDQCSVTHTPIRIILIEKKTLEQMKERERQEEKNVGFFVKELHRLARLKLHGVVHSDEHIQELPIVDVREPIPTIPTMEEALKAEAANEDRHKLIWESISNRQLPKINDAVNHPSHYNSGKIEVIDFIEDQKLGMHLGNTVKYIARAGKKNPGKTIEDLEKARWYLDRKIQLLKAANED